MVPDSLPKGEGESGTETRLGTVLVPDTLPIEGEGESGTVAYRKPLWAIACVGRSFCVYSHAFWLNLKLSTS